MPRRRPTPSLLLSAVLGTVAILPWAVSGLPGDDASAHNSATAITQQPLRDLGTGETIREIRQDTPFSLVALTAEDLPTTQGGAR